MGRTLLLLYAASVVLALPIAMVVGNIMLAVQTMFYRLQHRSSAACSQ